METTSLLFDFSVDNDQSQKYLLITERRQIMASRFYCMVGRLVILFFMVLIFGEVQSGVGDLELVSVDGSEAQATNSSSNAAISGDGRYVVFQSIATHLVPNDFNSREDIFVRDRLTGDTSRLNLSDSLSETNNVSSDPSISADGRYVTFGSLATNLVGGDTNSVQDIFVRDRQTNTTTRVSVATGGSQANYPGSSYRPSISADGRFVAFDSVATNLVGSDTNALSDVFVHDR